MAKKKKNKKLPPFVISALSAALVALGFGACGSQNTVVVDRKSALEAKLYDINSNESRLMALRNDLLDRRSEIERMGRQVCVYGGPNMMRQDVQPPVVDGNDEQLESIDKEIRKTEYKIDSLQNERIKTLDELESLTEKK